VEEELKKANLYVHSANREGFGLTIVEAMAAGLPVISFNAKGNKDIITNGVNGFLLKNKKASNFGEIIIELFNNKEKYQKVSSQGLKTSLKYGLDNYVKNLILIYNTNES
jgi:glycosyltransferase involved in cell wall biosynthesis